MYCFNLIVFDPKNKVIFLIILCLKSYIELSLLGGFN